MHILRLKENNVNNQIPWDLKRSEHTRRKIVLCSYYFLFFYWNTVIDFQLPWDLKRTKPFLLSDRDFSCPEADHQKKNSSKVWLVSLRSVCCVDSKKLWIRILAWGPPEKSLFMWNRIFKQGNCCFSKGKKAENLAFLH